MIAQSADREHFICTAEWDPSPPGFDFFDRMTYEWLQSECLQTSVWSKPPAGTSAVHLIGGNVQLCGMPVERRPGTGYARSDPLRALYNVADSQRDLNLPKDPARETLIGSDPSVPSSVTELVRAVSESSMLLSTGYHGIADKIETYSQAAAALRAKGGRWSPFSECQTDEDKDKVREQV